MTGGPSQSYRVLASLIEEHRKASQLWTPATDGLEHQIARDINQTLRGMGLTGSQASYLMENIL